MIQLTPQQQAVINHTYGPALVFAVAGAGKTTALEQRIVRLVRERIFAPERVLAVAYNTAVKEELGTRLRRHRGCGQVEVMTLHALGLRAVRMAWEAGLLPHLKRNAFQETEYAQEAILNGAMAEARRRKVSYLRELDSLDRADFFTWLSSCKGNLFYPNKAELSPLLRQTGHAQQAAAPPQTPWYLPFSQLVAEVQEARGLLTFDDQLRVGWEVLASYPAIRTPLQQSFDCVLVDEFQDVNLSQYLILDMLTAPHRNYMVVGDDDQTIYEWRGANPHFILNFEKEYKAARYVMSENFRCPAGPLTLANAVIRHNRQRYPKSLRLTQGLGGTTTVEHSKDRREMGQAIVTTIRNLLAKGDRIQEMAVLVRAKAQTPPVELALIQAQLPYEVVGSQPFYARWEITTLISYCRLARFEQHLQRHKGLTPYEAKQLIETWEEVYRHPKRYIGHNEAQQIGAEMARGDAPITQVLRKFTIADKPHISARLTELAKLVEWLSGALADDAKKGKAKGKSAHAVLQELERKLGYCAYLEQRGTRSESGVDEAENVRQFIEEAKDRGNLHDYLVYLKQLADQQAAQQAAAGKNLITIRTIHSAKGLEWPVVIIPSCDDGNIPHRKNDNVEEERRLFYVALTRSRRDLYIYHLNKEPSSFLAQAKWWSVLKAVTQLRSALDKSPSTWSNEEIRAVAIHAPQLGLLEYIQDWLPWSAEERGALVQTVSAFLARENGAGRQRLDKEMGEWRKLASPGVSLGNVEPEAADKGRESWLAQETKEPEKLLKQQPKVDTQSSPTAKGRAATTRAKGRQAFDVVYHPQHGQGIVISTTTTTSGRELKVQFVDGTLVHFRDDDPALKNE